MYDFLLFASSVLFIALAFAYSRHQAASLAHPATFYLVFHGFLFVFRPIVARIYDFDFVYRLYDFRPSISDKITVLLGANLALVVFLGASLAIAAREVPREPSGSAEEARRKLFWPVMITTGLLTPLGLASQIAYWGQRATEFETMTRDAGTGNLVNTENIGWFTDAALIIAPLAVLVLWVARFRWWGWLYFAGFAFLQAGSGTRHALVFAVAAIAVAWVLETGRKWFDWRLAALGLATVVAFNQIVLDRGGAVRELVAENGYAAPVEPAELDPLEHMDFANLEYFEYIVYAVPQRTGSYDYFAHYLQIFTEPIPRHIWEDKPVGSPVQFFSLWDYGRPTGITASLPGAGWMSLGYPGIVIQTLVFAAIFGLFYRWLLLTRNTPVARLTYAMVIATAILGFRDGTLLTLLRNAPFYFGPLLIALIIARLLQPAILSRGTINANPTGETPEDRRRALAARAGDTAR